jgi:N-acetyl-anhydromuramyl-L-alanine amidase AmpD
MTKTLAANMDIERNDIALMKNPASYPLAEMTTITMPTRGPFVNKGPQGACVHYTAGRRTGTTGLIQWGANQGLAFHVIDTQGNFFQTHSLQRWGYHAGTSSHKDFRGSMSQYLVGIELMAAGLLTTQEPPPKSGDRSVKKISARAWFDSQPRLYVARYNDGSYAGKKGWYEAFTEDQERALADFLYFCKKHFETFKCEYIFGHNEISPGRKDDPGAAHSLTMSELRAAIKNA